MLPGWLAVPLHDSAPSVINRLLYHQYITDAAATLPVQGGLPHDRMSCDSA
jgi:hypothetical protein